MPHRLLYRIFIACILFIADWYVMGGLRDAFKKRFFIHRSWFGWVYGVFSFALTVGLFASIYTGLGVGRRAVLMMLFFLLQMAKFCFMPFIIADDLGRLVVFLKKKKAKKADAVVATPALINNNEQQAVMAEDVPITRSAFLMKAGLIATTVPIVSVAAGLSTWAYDYQVKRVNLYLPNLPKAFDGMRIGQISDIHSGSFYNKKAVLGGVEMLMKEKADLVFFTGDLVNSLASEMYDYQDIFSKVKAPLGVYSIMGNHDYGDYFQWWHNWEKKRKNLNQLVATHKNLGWELLRNENRRLKIGNEEIGILGMENWGLLGGNPKYGNMQKTTQHTDDLPVKLLLSHDPSHWRAEVLPHYPQIDMVFAGHTHGMQFGVRAENFQWSPIQYVYREWAGLYREAHQQIYVNVGYGFLGMPGRVGILPEITIFTLKAGTDPKLGLVS